MTVGHEDTDVGGDSARIVERHSQKRFIWFPAVLHDRPHFVIKQDLSITVSSTHVHCHHHHRRRHHHHHHHRRQYSLCINAAQLWYSPTKPCFNNVKGINRKKQVVPALFFPNIVKWLRSVRWSYVKLLIHILIRCGTQSYYTLLGAMTLPLLSELVEASEILWDRTQSETL